MRPVYRNRDRRYHWEAVAGIAAMILMLGMGPDQGSSASSLWSRISSHPATISLSQSYPTVGQSEVLSAQGLTPGTRVALIWQTVTGHWKVNGSRFIGAQYQYGVKTLGHATANAQGEASVRFTVPSGFGGAHLVGLELSSGKMAGVSSVTIIPSVKLASSSVAEGGFFQFTMTGIGYSPYFAQYPVTYDNRLTGNVTAVNTDGTAHFSVRAEGVGPNEIQINNGVNGGPYLNEQQSPFPWQPTAFAFPVTVLPGIPKDTSDALPTLPTEVGSHIAASPGSGVVGSSYTLHGRGLLPHHTYDLTWWTMKGSHVSSAGYRKMAVPLGTVTTDSHGSFRKAMTVPSDLGGPAHTITLTSQSRVVSKTAFRIFPKVELVTPNPAPQGSLITVEILGGGWTYYDNIYSVNYDNSFIGFGCAFNSQGNLQIQLRATGAPGFHFIDIYPSIWKGKQTLPNPYLLPQLTYNADHPGDWLPAFHLVIKVIGPK